jgi:hypothetical protein
MRADGGGRSRIGRYAKVVLYRRKLSDLRSRWSEGYAGPSLTREWSEAQIL